MRNFQERVAVVTGAASGIGRATAVALAKKGCHIAISDVNAEGLAETSTTIRALNRKCFSQTVDVSEKTQMVDFAAGVEAQLGPAAILVNNAGVSVGESFEEHSLEDFEWIVGINFWGVIYGCKFFLPQLRKNEEAHIVNLSSVFGLMGVPLQTSYCATKFAVRGFSEALWTELSEHNIGVTSVHPAGVKTNIARSARISNLERAQLGVDLIDRVGVKPEYAAARIVRAIERNQMRLLVSRDSYVIDQAKRWLPVLTQKIARRSYQRMLRST